MNFGNRTELPVRPCVRQPDRAPRQEPETPPSFRQKLRTPGLWAVGGVLVLGLLWAGCDNSKGEGAVSSDLLSAKPAFAAPEASSPSATPFFGEKTPAAVSPASDVLPEPKSASSHPSGDGSSSASSQKRFSYALGKSLTEIAPYLGLPALRSVRETIGYIEALRRIGAAVLPRLKPLSASSGSEVARAPGSPLEGAAETDSGKATREKVSSANKNPSGKSSSGEGMGRLGFSGLSSGLSSSGSAGQQEWASSVLREEFNKWLASRYESIFSQLQAEFERWLAVRESEELNNGLSSQPRPAWVDAPAEVKEGEFWQTVKAGPYTTPEECQAELRHEIQKALHAYAQKLFGEKGDISVSTISWDLDRLLPQLLVEQWEEIRLADFGPSVGRKPMHWVYGRLRFTRAVQEEIKHQYRRGVIDRRVRNVAAGMTGLLVLLGFTYGILRVRCNRLYPPTVC